MARISWHSLGLKTYLAAVDEWMAVDCVHTREEARVTPRGKNVRGPWKITNVTLKSLGKYGHGPHCSDRVSEALFFRWHGFCGDFSGLVSPILHVCVRLSWGSYKKVIFSINRLLCRPMLSLAFFSDFWWTPLMRASWFNDFYFASFLTFFNDHISPTYSFLMCF